MCRKNLNFNVVTGNEFSEKYYLNGSWIDEKYIA